MPKTLLLTLAALLVLPSAASAATATADIENRQGTRFGPVTFKAAPGEENLVVVTQANGRLRFHDSANSVRASGDCDQVDDQTASCPVTEDVAKVRLRNRGDVAVVSGLVRVFGGSGADVLRGSSGFDDLKGQRGGDSLHGRGSGDELTGGPGPDLLFGGRGDDDLVDGESDANTSRDIFTGGSHRNTAGSDRGDMVIYSSRDEALELNLKNGTAPDQDELRRIESATGGSGDDSLKGDDGENDLVGNGGADRIRGGDGNDFATGARGDDRVKGARGNDVLIGNRGVDVFRGGSGDDDLVGDDGTPEDLECGRGDDIARSNAADTLEECEIANSDPFFFQVQPEIDADSDTATFQVACQQLGGCDGGITLNGPRAENYGAGSFEDLPDDPETFTPVTVTLTDAAVEALAEGVVVGVFHSPTGGYKAFMQTGG